MITIQFNNPDEGSKIDRVLRFLRRENISFSYQFDAESNGSAKKSKDVFFAELKESVEEIRAIQQGEKPHGQSLDDFLDELDAELETEKNALENAHWTFIHL